MELIMSHGQIINGLKQADADLSELKAMMPQLIKLASDLAVAYQTGLLLSRHIVGGRIYLRWRYRSAISKSRKYLDLSEGEGRSYLAQFGKSVSKSMIEIDLKCRAINHAYTVAFATRTSLRKMLKHAQGMKANPRGHSVDGVN